MKRHEQWKKFIKMYKNIKWKSADRGFIFKTREGSDYNGRFDSYKRTDTRSNRYARGYRKGQRSLSAENQRRIRDLPLVNYEFEDKDAAMDIRSGYVMGDEQLHGMKMLNNFPHNTEKGLQPFNGIMLVYDSNTGIPAGVMDASYITCMRTGAAGAVGADALARKDARTLMLLGAGKQAPFQIAATLILRPEINKVYIVDPVNYPQACGLAERIKTSLRMNLMWTLPEWSSSPKSQLKKLSATVTSLSP